MTTLTQKKIKLYKGPAPAVTCSALGEFGIIENIPRAGGWGLFHVPSKTFMSRSFNEKEKAVRAMEFLMQTGMDWNFQSLDALYEQNEMDFRQINDLLIKATAIANSPADATHKDIEDLYEALLYAEYGPDDEAVKQQLSEDHPHMHGVVFAKTVKDAIDSYD